MQGIHGGAFDDVKNAVGEEGGAQEALMGNLRDDGSAEGVAQEKDVGKFGPGEVCRGGCEDEMKIGGESGEGKVKR